jgi:hypothetical protein
VPATAATGTDAAAAFKKARRDGALIPELSDIESRLPVFGLIHNIEFIRVCIPSYSFQ